MTEFVYVTPDGYGSDERYGTFEEAAEAARLWLNNLAPLERCLSSTRFAAIYRLEGLVTVPNGQVVGKRVGMVQRYDELKTTYKTSSRE